MRSSNMQLAALPADICNHDIRFGVELFKWDKDSVFFFSCYTIKKIGTNKTRKTGKMMKHRCSNNYKCTPTEVKLTHAHARLSSCSFKNLSPEKLLC